jgi:hypothetical protein
MKVFGAQMKYKSILFNKSVASPNTLHTCHKHFTVAVWVHTGMLICPKKINWSNIIQ